MVFLLSLDDIVQRTIQTQFYRFSLGATSPALEAEHFRADSLQSHGDGVDLSKLSKGKADLLAALPVRPTDLFVSIVIGRGLLERSQEIINFLIFLSFHIYSQLAKEEIELLFKRTHIQSHYLFLYVSAVDSYALAKLNRGDPRDLDLYPTCDLAQHLQLNHEDLG